MNLDADIAGVTCEAALPAGPGVAVPEHLVRLSYRQALLFLEALDRARPPPRGDSDESLGMVSLKFDSGGLRFRCWNSTDRVEIELWHASGRCWVANAPMTIAQKVVLSCPHLDRIYTLLQESASDFAEVEP